MNTHVERRPFGVGFLSVLVIIGGILDLIGGVVLLTQRNDDDLLDAIGATSSELTTASIVAIVFGVVVILVGSALHNGANWARLLIGLIAVARLATFVWVAVAYHRVHWYDALGPVIIYALVAGYLFFDEDAKRFFANR